MLSDADVTTKLTLLAERAARMGLLRPRETSASQVAGLAFLTAETPSGEDMLRGLKYFKRSLATQGGRRIVSVGPQTYPPTPQELKTMSPLWWKHCYEEEGPAECPLNRARVAQAKMRMPCRCTSFFVQGRPLTRGGSFDRTPVLPQPSVAQALGQMLLTYYSPAAEEMQRCLGMTRGSGPDGLIRILSPDERRQPAPPPSTETSPSASPRDIGSQQAMENGEVATAPATQRLAALEDGEAAPAAAAGQDRRETTSGGANAEMREMLDEFASILRPGKNNRPGAHGKGARAMKRPTVIRPAKVMKKAKKRATTTKS